jgi:hypothetical protein
LTEAAWTQTPSGEDEIVNLCPFCGWPEAELFDVASRHRTTEGQTVWTRCACGSLQMRVLGRTGSRIVARSRGRLDADEQSPVDCRT